MLQQQQNSSGRGEGTRTQTRKSEAGAGSPTPTPPLLLLLLLLLPLLLLPLLPPGSGKERVLLLRRLRRWAGDDSHGGRSLLAHNLKLHAPLALLCAGGVVRAGWVGCG